MSRIFQINCFCPPIPTPPHTQQAFELLCDLLVLYSANSVRSEPALQNLYYQPSYHLRAEMAAFLLDYIFLDEIEAEGISELYPNVTNLCHTQLALCLPYTQDALLDCFS